MAEHIFILCLARAEEHHLNVTVLENIVHDAFHKIHALLPREARYHADKELRIVFFKPDFALKRKLIFLFL